MVKVQICHIKRLKTQIHSLPCGINIIFGANGYIWVGAKNIQDMDLSQVDSETFWHVIIKNENELIKSVSIEDRQNIAILKVCIEILDNYGLPLYATSIVNAYDSAQSFALQELQSIEIQKQIAEEVKIKLLEIV